MSEISWDVKSVWIDNKRKEIERKTHLLAKIAQRKKLSCLWASGSILGIPGMNTTSLDLYSHEWYIYVRQNCLMIFSSEQSLPICMLSKYHIRVKFSNFYLLIGWKIKSYLANSEKFWPFGLYEGHKAKKGQKKNFGKWIRIA